jgi:hypothetical protein
LLFFATFSLLSFFFSASSGSAETKKPKVNFC